MKMPQRPIKTFTFFFLTVLLFNTSPAYADENLSEAIYLQDTVGDLEAAIDKYHNIIESSNNREIVANAMLRAAKSYEQLGKQTASDKLLKTLIEEYKDLPLVIKEIHTKDARLSVSEKKLLPPPWKNGELLRYELRPKGGNPTAYIVRSKTLLHSGNEKKWKTNFLNVSTTQKNVLQVEYLVEDKTNEMIEAKQIRVGETLFRNWVSDEEIHFENTVSKQNFSFKNKKNTFFILDVPDLIRRLPLKVGYEAKFKLHVPGFVGFYDAHIKVLKDNKVFNLSDTEFLAYELNVTVRSEQTTISSETLLISNDKNRYMLRVETGSLETVLVEYQSKAAVEPTTYRIKSENLSLTLPKGWIGFDTHLRSDESQRHVFIPLSGKTSALLGWKNREDINWTTHSVKDLMAESIRWGKSFYKGYAPAKESVETFEQAGLSAIRFQSNITSPPIDTVEDRVWLTKEPRIYSLAFYSSPRVYKEAKPSHSEIINGISALE